MDKKIYFAGSIRGGRQDAALYRKVIAAIQETDIVLTEHVKCNLPEDKKGVLDYIQKLIDGKEEAELRKYREYISRAF